MINLVGSGVLVRDLYEVLGSPELAIWPSTVIAIMTVVLSLPVSQAADYWGRKWILVILTACGCIGCIVVSRAQTMAVAIVGFTIGGVSYGAQPLFNAVSSEVLPRKYRPHATAVVNVASVVGAIIGILIGGALTKYNPAAFRTYWYIAAALYAISAAICAVLYNPPPRQLQLSLTLREKLARLDWAGYVLLTIGLVLFCISLTWSQNPYPWSNPRVSATFASGILFLIILIIYELRFKTDGVLHHDLFRNRNFPLALGCIFVDGVVFFANNDYLGTQLAVVYSVDSFNLGVHYTVFFAAGIVAAIAAGIYCSKTKTVRTPSIIAFLLFLTFNILMSTLGVGASVNRLWTYPIFGGFGLGISTTALVAIAQFSTPPELIAITSGLMISIRSLGGAIALAVFSAIYDHGVAQNLEEKVAAATIPLGLPAAELGVLLETLSGGGSPAAALEHIPGMTGQIAEAAVLAYQQALSIAFRYVWIAAAAFSLLAALGLYLSTLNLSQGTQLIPEEQRVASSWIRRPSSTRTSTRRRRSSGISGRRWRSKWHFSASLPPDHGAGSDIRELMCKQGVR